MTLKLSEKKLKNVVGNEKESEFCEFWDAGEMNLVPNVQNVCSKQR